LDEFAINLEGENNDEDRVGGGLQGREINPLKKARLADAQLSLSAKTRRHNIPKFQTWTQRNRCLDHSMRPSLTPSHEFTNKLVNVRSRHLALDLPAQAMNMLREL